MSARRRLEALEARSRPSRPSGARARMVGHLYRLAAYRRGELPPGEAAEVEAEHIAVEGRRREMRGEGA